MPWLLFLVSLPLVLLCHLCPVVLLTALTHHRAFIVLISSMAALTLLSPIPPSPIAVTPAAAAASLTHACRHPMQDSFISCLLWANTEDWQRGGEGEGAEGMQAHLRAGAARGWEKQRNRKKITASAPRLCLATSEMSALARRRPGEHRRALFLSMRCSKPHEHLEEMNTAGNGILGNGELLSLPQSPHVLACPSLGIWAPTCRGEGLSWQWRQE